MAAGAPEKGVSGLALKEAIRAFQPFPLADLTSQRRASCLTPSTGLLPTIST